MCANYLSMASQTLSVQCSRCRTSRAAEFIKLCGGCHTTKYCSVDCQRADWREGGHKLECKKIGAAASAAADRVKGETLKSVPEGQMNALFDLANMALSVSPPLVGQRTMQEYQASFPAARGNAASAEHKPKAPYYPGGPEIRAGWGNAYTWKTCFSSPLEIAVNKLNAVALESLINKGDDSMRIYSVCF